MSGYFTPTDRPRALPVDAHEGTRADFLGRVRAEAVDAARTGGEARTRFLNAALRYVSDPRTLYAAARYVGRHGGPARGADHIGPTDLDARSVSRLVTALFGVLRDGTYRPGAVRPVDVPKPAGGTRRLSVLTVADRVVEKAVVLVLGPFLDAQFSPTAFGGRPGRSTAAAVAAVATQAARTGCFVAVTADVRKAFDTVPHDRMIAVLTARLGDTPLTALLETIVRGRGENGVGLAQGGAASMLLLNLYLDELVARPWRTLHPDRPCFWYVDDVLALAADADEGRRLLADLGRLTAEAGLSLKPTAAVTDLTAGTTEWLGYRIGIGPSGLTAWTAGTSWTQLENHLEAAHGESNPDVRARNVTLGWISAQGPALRMKDRTATVDRICSLLTKTDFPGVVTGTELKLAMGQSYTRYETALTLARTEPAHTLVTDQTDESGEAAAASPARTIALIVPADGENPTPSTPSDADRPRPKPDTISTSDVANRVEHPEPHVKRSGSDAPAAGASAKTAPGLRSFGTRPPSARRTRAARPESDLDDPDGRGARAARGRSVADQQPHSRRPGRSGTSHRAPAGCAPGRVRT